MGRAAICAAVLLAGSLYPLWRHHPWTMFCERRAILETLERHPKVKLHRLVAERGPRLRAELLVDADEVLKLIAFRKAIKDHRLLSKHETQWEVAWWCGGGGAPPPSTVKCSFLVLPEQR